MQIETYFKNFPLLSYQTYSNFLASAGQYIMNQAKNGKTFQTCNGLNTQQKIRHRFNLNSPLSHLKILTDRSVQVF